MQIVHAQLHPYSNSARSLIYLNQMMKSKDFEKFKTNNELYKPIFDSCGSKSLKDVVYTIQQALIDSYNSKINKITTNIDMKILGKHIIVEVLDIQFD